MSEESQNHYQVLRIERTVDERAIKKAYFTLIREFPPDKHPEEFKKIREAYEVLSDPVARQRFDAADKGFEEYGDEIGARLRAAEELIKAGSDAEAQAALTALLEEHPTLTVARENLAFSHMRTGTHEEALKQWKRLSKDAPDEPRYHFHKGITWNRLDQEDKALAAVQKAHNLKPEELRFHLALIDLLLAKRDLSEALAEIDDAIERHGEESDQAMLLRLRRADGLFSQGRLADAEEDATLFFESVRKLADPEAPKYFSTQLAGIAAKLFARDEPDRANALLARCKELNPTSTVEHPYPTSAELRLQDLPPEAEEWLRLQVPGPTSPTFEEGIWAPKVALLIGLCFALALFLHLLFDAPVRWTPPSLFFTALGLGVLAAGLTYVLRDIWQVVKSPLRGMITVHPLYLVRTRADRLKVYPLFRLTKTHGVHQHTNGGYTHTSVTLHFGKETVALRIVGKEYAQGWLDYFVNRRRRALELMVEGYLEAEQGVEMIPPVLLTRPSPARAKEKVLARRWYGGAAVAAAAALAVIVPLHAARADDHAYRLAVRAQPSSYADYLTAYPDGRHAEEVKRALARPHTAAVASFKELFLGGEKQGASTAIPAALEVLHAAGVSTVPVTIISTVDLSPFSESDRRGADWTFGATATAARESALLTRMRRIFEAAGVGAVMQLKSAAESAELEAPVTLTIRKKTTTDGKLFESQGRPAIPSLQIAWEAVLSVKGSAAPLWHFETITASPAELRLDGREPGQLLDRALRQMELLGLDDFSAKIARELGLSREPPPPQGTSQDAPERTRSPYER